MWGTRVQILEGVLLKKMAQNFQFSNLHLPKFIKLEYPLATNRGINSNL